MHPGNIRILTGPGGMRFFIGHRNVLLRRSGAFFPPEGTYGRGGFREVCFKSFHMYDGPKSVANAWFGDIL